MNNNSKNNSRNVVTMNQASQSYAAQESSKMCLFEPRVFSDTQDIADELKQTCNFSKFTTHRSSISKAYY